MNTTGSSESSSEARFERSFQKQASYDMLYRNEERAYCWWIRHMMAGQGRAGPGLGVWLATYLLKYEKKRNVILTINQA
jgi:hypothetical protein